MIPRYSGVNSKSDPVPFVKFTKHPNYWAQEILAYFIRQIINGVSEGINNVAKVFKRRNYGFHDIEYFFVFSSSYLFVATLNTTF